jgi:DNA-binding GntR family transcriptional regulator
MPREIKNGRQQIYETLRDEIVSKTLNGGERLSEAQLSARFNVSRTPIREVLRQLERDGFVSLTPNAGVNVAKITAEVATEYFQLAAALEAFAVEAAVEKGIDDAQIAFLEGLNREMEFHAKKGDIQSTDRLNNQFHNFFVEQSSNKVILATLQDAHRKMFIPFENFHTREDRMEYVRQHDEIVDRLRSRDVPGAGYAMKRHILTIVDNLAGRYRAKANAGWLSYG